uniref:Uncharacterized protein n=1 Tax=Rhodosorus marinus TaxID=101924 RepID=A0A7S2ZNH3_9RHOD|mmetsp:Transcript_26175/g.102556  ORF Transcript_26175/g.102556 Transcript_26175/m.102556 type:complete len:130 (+) Transcript_26175:634-1023(+)
MFPAEAEFSRWTHHSARLNWRNTDEPIVWSAFSETSLRLSLSLLIVLSSFPMTTQLKRKETPDPSSGDGLMEAMVEEMLDSEYLIQDDFDEIAAEQGRGDPPDKGSDSDLCFGCSQNLDAVCWQPADVF